MRTIVIESPFKNDPENLDYARRCLADSLARGEAPFASHLLYPLVLDDGDERQRAEGLQAGLDIGARLDGRAFYLDRGFTSGMSKGLIASIACGSLIRFRMFDDPRGYSDADPAWDRIYARDVSDAEACELFPEIRALLVGE